jgi:PAS domain S-box-containing protein
MAVALLRVGRGASLRRDRLRLSLFPKPSTRFIRSNFEIKIASGLHVDHSRFKNMVQRFNKQPEQEFFRLVFNTAAVGMLLIDENGIIVLANNQMLDISGYSEEELIHKPVEILVFEQSRELHPLYRKEFFRYQQAKLPPGTGFTLKRKDGSEIPVEIELHPIDLQKKHYIVASITDKSDRRRAEEAAEARDKAIQESRLKSAFVANISHELRTPLSGIIGMNELLMSSKLDDEQRSLAQTISDSAHSLLTIINDLLDLSKIEAGKTTLRIIPFSPIALVQEALRLFADAARSKKLALTSQLDHSIPDYVLGDPDRIRQILLNLLGNAIKFTEQGSITMQLKLIAEKENEVTLLFIVQDTGIGIAKEDLPLLFRPFTQLDSTAKRRFGGTGLGLSVSRTLVELMGGELSVESEQGVGSTFSFAVTLKKLAVPKVELNNNVPLSSINEPKQIAEKVSVLVVEDNHTLQELAVKQLSMIGYDAKAVFTGQQAVDAVREDPFDLIFMDCNLPEMDGFEATRVIRQIDALRNRHTFIIAMTAAAMSGDKEKCFAAGMDDYLTKPVTLSNLREHLSKWQKINHLNEI